MRLNRLDLTRYGKFTGRSIDFGTQLPGRPDLHVVYGPNEAGKSTALSAYLDLLFGIETRSRFNFLHPFDTMRVGGSLEIAGTVHELARIKRTRSTLLDSNGQPVGEALLSGQLGGIDRESYRAMFSLDDDTLEAGGESILASKGDLGQLLFSASAGLAGLSRKLTELRQEADGFYRYHAHNTGLTACKERLAGLKQQRESIDTAASHYAVLLDARNVAKQQYEAAIAARAAVQARMEAIQRQAGALPRLAALRALRAQLAPLSSLPAAPPGCSDELPELQMQAIALTAQRAGVAQDLADAAAALEAIKVDEAALAVAGQLDRLNHLHARYVTAATDIPVRMLEAREAELHIAGILGRIGRADEPDPARLLLNAATVAALQDLIAKRSGIETASQAAENELRESRDRLQDDEAALLAAAPDAAAAAGPAHLAALAAAVAAAQRSDAAIRQRRAGRDCTRHQDTVTERLLALRPWHGDAGQLAVLAVPDAADLQNWQAELTAARNQHARREQEQERAREEQARCAAARSAIVQGSGVVGDHEAAVIRAAREAAWATHRRALTGATADDFEAALRQDDIVMDTRLRHQADLMRLHQAGEALARAAADLARAQDESDKAQARLQRIQDRLATAAAAFLPDASLDTLKEWLGRRDKALEAHAELLQAGRDLRDAEIDAADLRRGLHEALHSAGIAHDPASTIDALRAVAQTVLDREHRMKLLREAVAERRRDVQSRERRQKAAADRDAAWHAAWDTACGGCWLGGSGTSPAVATVREILSTLPNLDRTLQQRTSLLGRVEQMQADQRDFAAEVARLGQSLGWDSDGAAPLETAQRISRAVDAARTAATLRANQVRQQEALRQRQHDITETQRTHDARSSAMTGYFQVASLSEVAARLADIARKADLERQAEDAARDILEAMRVTSIADAEQLLASVDRGALDAELAALRAKFDDQDQRGRDLFARYSQAKDQVEQVGGDAAAARIEEQRRTLLLDIEDRAACYLRLRAGIAAAEQALRAYRQQHRSGMMARASEAFQTISRGAYTGLASQPSKDGEDLIALGADGSSKVADQLSKGTRFQLYLALRFAGYCEFARLRPPVPFIADDILETFDDDRAEQAVRLLAGIGEMGQAIYLTHHRHLCDIARQVCPDARIHQL